MNDKGIMEPMSINVSNDTGVVPSFERLDLFEICRIAKQGNNETYLNRTQEINSTFYDQALWMLLDGVEPIAMAVFYAIFFVIAFTWNLVILMVMLIRRKVFKEAAHVFLANLVLTDLLIAVFIILVALVSSIPGEWVLGTDDAVRCYTCEISGFFVTFLVDLSVHTLAVLSLDRTLHLAFPLKYRTVMTRVKALLILIVIWVVVLALNILPFFDVGIIEFNQRLGLCLVRWSQSTPGSFIYVGVLLAELLIPIIVLIVANTLTFRIVSRVLKRAHKRKKTLRKMSTRRQRNVQEQLSREQANTEEDRQYHKQQKQLVQHFTASFIASILCWMWIFIMYIVVIAAPEDTIPPYLFTISFYFYLLTAIVHPMLETYFIPELRLFFGRIKTNMKKELTKQTSSIIEKKRKISAVNSQGTPSDGTRQDSSFADSSFTSRVGEENPAFGKPVMSLSPLIEASCENNNTFLTKPHDVDTSEDLIENPRGSTSNESGVFSEVQDHEETHADL